MNRLIRIAVFGAWFSCAGVAAPTSEGDRRTDSGPTFFENRLLESTKNSQQVSIEKVKTPDELVKVLRERAEKATGETRSALHVVAVLVRAYAQPIPGALGPGGARPLDELTAALEFLDHFLEEWAVQPGMPVPSVWSDALKDRSLDLPKGIKKWWSDREKFNTGVSSNTNSIPKQGGAGDSSRKAYILSKELKRELESGLIYAILSAMRGKDLKGRWEVWSQSAKMPERSILRTLAEEESKRLWPFSVLLDEKERSMVQDANIAIGVIRGAQLVPSNYILPDPVELSVWLVGKPYEQVRRHLAEVGHGTSLNALIPKKDLELFGRIFPNAAVAERQFWLEKIASGEFTGDRSILQAIYLAEDNHLWRVAGTMPRIIASLQYLGSLSTDERAKLWRRFQPWLEVHANRPEFAEQLFAWRRTINLRSQLPAYDELVGRAVDRFFLVEPKVKKARSGDVGAFDFFSGQAIYFQPPYRDRFLAKLAEGDGDLEIVDLAMNLVSPLSGRSSAGLGGKAEVAANIENFLKERPRRSDQAKLLLLELARDDDAKFENPAYEAIAAAIAMLKSARAWQVSDLAILQAASGLDSLVGPQQKRRLEESLRKSAQTQLPLVASEINHVMDARLLIAVAQVLASSDMLKSFARSPKWSANGRPNPNSVLNPLDELNRAGEWQRVIRACDPKVAPVSISDDLAVRAVIALSQRGLVSPEADSGAKEFAEYRNWLGRLDEVSARRPKDGSSAMAYVAVQEAFAKSDPAAMQAARKTAIDACTVEGGASARYVRLLASYLVDPVAFTGIENSSDLLDADDMKSLSGPARSIASLIAGRYFYRRQDTTRALAEFGSASLQHGAGFFSGTHWHGFIAKQDVERAREENMILRARAGVEAEEVLAHYAPQVNGGSAWHNPREVHEAAGLTYARMGQWPEAERAFRRMRDADPAKFNRWPEFYRAWLQQQPPSQNARSLVIAARGWWGREARTMRWTDLDGTKNAWQDLDRRDSLERVREWGKAHAIDLPGYDAGESAVVAYVALRLVKSDAESQNNLFGTAPVRAGFEEIALAWAAKDPASVRRRDDINPSAIRNWVASITDRAGSVDFSAWAQGALEAARDALVAEGDQISRARLLLLGPSCWIDDSQSWAKAIPYWVEIVKEPSLFGTIEFGAAMELIDAKSGGP